MVAPAVERRGRQGMVIIQIREAMVVVAVRQPQAVLPVIMPAIRGWRVRPVLAAAARLPKVTAAAAAAIMAVVPVHLAAAVAARPTQTRQ